MAWTSSIESRSSPWKPARKPSSPPAPSARRSCCSCRESAMALEYFAWHTGPLTMPPSQAGAFAKSDPSQPTPNIEWHVQPLSLDKFGDPLHSFPAITPSVCNLRPASRGWVRIKSPNPADYPEIRLNYLREAEDRKVAVDAMRFTRRIMATKALAKYQPEEYKPGSSIQD